MSEADSAADTEQASETVEDDGSYWLGTPAGLKIELPVFLTGVGTGMIGTTFLASTMPNRIILAVAAVFIIAGIATGAMYNR